MLLYVCFRFSEVMDQMFLTDRGVVQGSFMATLGVASVFVHQDGELEDVPPTSTTNTTSGFFSVLI